MRTFTLAVLARWRQTPAVIVAMLAIALMNAPAQASAPACYSYNGSGYCQYDGRVTQVYVNYANQILLYFDAPLAPAALAAAGISGVSNYGAAVYPMSENIEYAKMLYATLLTAQARGATISVQLWGTSGGYLKMDRIWISE